MCRAGGCSKNIPCRKLPDDALKTTGFSLKNKQRKKVLHGRVPFQGTPQMGDIFISHVRNGANATMCHPDPPSVLTLSHCWKVPWSVAWPPACWGRSSRSSDHQLACQLTHELNMGDQSQHPLLCPQNLGSAYLCQRLLQGQSLETVMWC